MFDDAGGHDWVSHDIFVTCKQQQQQQQEGKGVYGTAAAAVPRKTSKMLRFHYQSLPCRNSGDKQSSTATATAAAKPNRFLMPLDSARWK